MWTPKELQIHFLCGKIRENTSGQTHSSSHVRNMQCVVSMETCKYFITYFNFYQLTVLSSTLYLNVRFSGAVCLLHEHSHKNSCGFFCFCHKTGTMTLIYTEISAVTQKDNSAFIVIVPPVLIILQHMCITMKMCW